MLTTLIAVAPFSFHTMDAPTAIFATKAFGVGRGFAVLVVIFASLFGLMVLGGHVRGSARRRRSQKRP